MANTKTVAVNKKAAFNYQFLEIFEAGIALTGPEVKSIKAGQISIKEAFATIKNGEAYLTNAHVSPYKPASFNNSEPTRPRKLILKKSEIAKLSGAVNAAGNTLVPLKVYLKNGFIKVEIALARGKKIHDKREKIKSQDQKRDLEREIKEKLR